MSWYPAIKKASADDRQELNEQRRLRRAKKALDTTASSRGFAALVAPGVRNSGTITATLGTVALASGNSFTLRVVDMVGQACTSP